VPSLEDIDKLQHTTRENATGRKLGSSANIPRYLRYLVVITTNHQCFYVGLTPVQQLSKSNAPRCKIDARLAFNI
jgi:hypothetical protein